MTAMQILLILAGAGLLLFIALVSISVLAARENARIDARIDEAMLPDLKQTYDNALRNAQARGADLDSAAMEAWRASVHRLCEWKAEVLIVRLSKRGTATGRYAESRIRPIIERAFKTGAIAGIAAAEAGFGLGAKRMTDISPLIEELMAKTTDEALKEI